jgi:hypothetical protein
MQHVAVVTQSYTSGRSNFVDIDILVDVYDVLPLWMNLPLAITNKNDKVLLTSLIVLCIIRLKGLLTTILPCTKFLN